MQHSQQRNRKRSKPKWTGCFLLATVVTMISCKEKEVWIKPVSAPITEAVFASGYLEPVQQIMLTSLNEGYLQKKLVSEGEVVRKDEVLFQLDNTTINLEVQAAKENLQLAIINASPQSPVLQKLQNDLEAAVRKRAQDSVQYDRLHALYHTQAVAQVDVDNARLLFELDKTNVQSLQESIASTRISLQQALIQARSQYKTKAAGQGYYALAAPEKCRVYRIFKKQGELIRKGESVAMLGHPDSLVVMVLVDEAGISKIIKNQQVLVELNTDKGKVHEAKVSRIYPYFDNETQSFRIEASMIHPPDAMVAGTLLQANIIVAHRDQALLIPRSCLSPDGKVMVKRETGSELITPRTGIVSTDWVEILGGIAPDEMVLKTF